MKTITKSCIRLDARANGKDDAIRLAGQLLADAGYIESGYIASLLKREQVANTFLGGGVAIPHGMIEDRHLIRHTGIAILQLRDGIEWNEGQKAHLVVAIAAQSDEHIAVLRRLTRLMQQPEALDILFHAENPLVLIAALGDAAEPRSATLRNRFLFRRRRKRPPGRLTPKPPGPWTIPTVCMPVPPPAGSKPPSASLASCGFIKMPNSPTPKG